MILFSMSQHIFIIYQNLVMLKRDVLLLCCCGSDLSRGQDVVHVLQEGLVFNFIVSEDETGPFALLAGCSVQALQVLHQVGCVVRSGVGQST